MEIVPNGFSNNKKKKTENTLFILAHLRSMQNERNGQFGRKNANFTNVFIAENKTNEHFHFLLWNACIFFPDAEISILNAL